MPHKISNSMHYRPCTRISEHWRKWPWMIERCRDGSLSVKAAVSCAYRWTLKEQICDIYYCTMLEMTNWQHITKSAGIIAETLSSFWHCVFATWALFQVAHQSHMCYFLCTLPPAGPNKHQSFKAFSRRQLVKVKLWSLYIPVRFWCASHSHTDHLCFFSFKWQMFNRALVTMTQVCTTIVYVSRGWTLLQIHFPECLSVPLIM